MWNETRRANLTRIKSARKRQVLIGLAAAAVCILAVLVVLAIKLFGGQGVPSDKPVKLVLSKGTPAAKTFTLETVTTPTAQEKGLGDRTSLAPDAGMLFKYDGPGNRCIWMKDMRFNIDVVWADNTKRVTSIVPDMKPGSYPQQYCATAQYVIELNAGVTRSNGLRVGQVIDF